MVAAVVVVMPIVYSLLFTIDEFLTSSREKEILFLNEYFVIMTIYFVFHSVLCISY